MKSFKICLGVMVCTFSCILFGCGSDNSSAISSSQKAHQPPAKKNLQVMEVLADSPSGSGGANKPVPQRRMGAQGLELTPPNKAGMSVISQQELEAALKNSPKIDRKPMEIIPPSKPGERGVTQAQVDALKPTSNIDRGAIELVPPSKPGERGLIQAQLEGMKPAKSAEASDNLEVIPPGKPGEHGLSQQDFSKIKASRKHSGGDSQPPLPLATQK